MEKERSYQVIKTRDDHSPVRIEYEAPQSDPNRPFVIPAGEECFWMKDEEPFGSEVLRPRVEPWLTALVQSEHLSLLIGSGLTHAVHNIATGSVMAGMNSVTFGVLDDAISVEAQRIAQTAGRQKGNFEDQIRVANELLRGLEILPPSETETSPNSEVHALRAAVDKALEDFASSILQAERNLELSDDTKRNEAFSYLVNFLMTFASRTGTRERLNLFTTNYDRYIEAGSDVAGLRTIDRFVGSLAPVFRASRLDIDLHYNPPGIRGEPRYLEGVARFTKLHGSIDWVEHGGSIRRIALPFGAQQFRPFLTVSGHSNLDGRQLMIYPNAAKDRETAQYPYVELFRDFATTICRPNSTLVCYGYGFGDEHINRVIEDMLTIPSTHLVIMAYNDPLGRIMDTYIRMGKPSQLTLLIGDHLGDLKALVDRYLPKSSIDRTTFRMANLIGARMNTRQPEADTNRNTASDGEETQ